VSERVSERAKERERASEKERTHAQCLYVCVGTGGDREGQRETKNISVFCPKKMGLCASPTCACVRVYTQVKKHEARTSEQALSY
jgi:hypothetical protein